MAIGCQKIVNLLDNTPNPPSKFRTKTWGEINNDSHWTYNTNSQIKCKTSMLKSCLCHYDDACILVKGTITVPNTAASGAGPENSNKKLIFKNCWLHEQNEQYQKWVMLKTLM